MANRPQTTTQDWIDTGYNALCRGGLDEVNIESLAADLGVSKAGFYHRFANRQELIEAVVDQWIIDRQERIEQFGGPDDPIGRLRGSLAGLLNDDKLRRADAWLLLHDPAEPALGARTQVVRQQFKGFGKRNLVDAGFGKQQSEVRAHLLYTGYLGLVADLVVRGKPVGPAEVRLLVDQLVTMITAGQPEPVRAAKV